jgi:NAD(P)-dependent dehydrogenase (short-subunit alcohol dehydrogenase family)
MDARSPCEGRSTQNDPEESAAAVIYLASDESAFMTGSAFVIDGAMTAR